ncbi:MAG: hypothetical protein CMH83_05950 [Nocardioides sp.]|nr:hypothetical protein [Nocardioides sp.]
MHISSRRAPRLHTLLAAFALALLAGLLAPGVTASPADAAAPSWGATASGDKEIKRGCHGYRFAYRVTAPGDEWMAEVVLQDKRGRGLASRELRSDMDAARGKRAFRVCDSSLSRGRHVIRMRVTSFDGRDQTVRWVDPTVVRFKRR